MPAGGPKLNRNKASQDVKKQDNLDTFLKQLESGLETNIKGELGALKVEIAQTIMEKLGLPAGSEMDVTKEYADAFSQVMKSLTESGEKVGMDQVEGVTIIHVDETTDIEVLEMKVEPLLSYYEMTIEDGMMQFTNQAGELSIVIALDKEPVDSEHLSSKELSIEEMTQKLFDAGFTLPPNVKDLTLYDEQKDFVPRNKECYNSLIKYGPELKKIGFNMSLINEDIVLNEEYMTIARKYGKRLIDAGFKKFGFGDLVLLSNFQGDIEKAIERSVILISNGYRFGWDTDYQKIIDLDEKVMQTTLKRGPKLKEAGYAFTIQAIDTIYKHESSIQRIIERGPKLKEAGFNTKTFGINLFSLKNEELQHAVTWLPKLKQAGFESKYINIKDISLEKKHLEDAIQRGPKLQEAGIKLSLSSLDKVFLDKEKLNFLLKRGPKLRKAGFNISLREGIYMPTDEKLILDAIDNSSAYVSAGFELSGSDIDFISKDSGTLENFLEYGSTLESLGLEYKMRDLTYFPKKDIIPIIIKWKEKLVQTGFKVDKSSVRSIGIDQKVIQDAILLAPKWKELGYELTLDRISIIADQALLDQQKKWGKKFKDIGIPLNESYYSKLSVTEDEANIEKFLLYTPQLQEAGFDIFLHSLSKLSSIDESTLSFALKRGPKFKSIGYKLNIHSIDKLSKANVNDIETLIKRGPQLAAAGFELTGQFNDFSNHEKEMPTLLKWGPKLTAAGFTLQLSSLADISKDDIDLAHAIKRCPKLIEAGFDDYKYTYNIQGLPKSESVIERAILRGPKFKKAGFRLNNISEKAFKENDVKLEKVIDRGKKLHVSGYTNLSINSIKTILNNESRLPVIISEASTLKEIYGSNLIYTYRNRVPENIDQINNALKLKKAGYEISYNSLSHVPADSSIIDGMVKRKSTLGDLGIKINERDYSKIESVDITGIEIAKKRGKKMQDAGYEFSFNTIQRLPKDDKIIQQAINLGPELKELGFQLINPNWINQLPVDDDQMKLLTGRFTYLQDYDSTFYLFNLEGIFINPQNTDTCIELYGRLKKAGIALNMSGFKMKGMSQLIENIEMTEYLLALRNTGVSVLNIYNTEHIIDNNLVALAQKLVPRFKKIGLRVEMKDIHYLHSDPKKIDLFIALKEKGYDGTLDVLDTIEATSPILAHVLQEDNAMYQKIFGSIDKLLFHERRYGDKAIPKLKSMFSTVEAIEYFDPLVEGDAGVIALNFEKDEEQKIDFDGAYKEMLSKPKDNLAALIIMYAKIEVGEGSYYPKDVKEKIKLYVEGEGKNEVYTYVNTTLEKMLNEMNVTAFDLRFLGSLRDIGVGNLGHVETIVDHCNLLANKIYATQSLDKKTEFSIYKIGKKLFEQQKKRSQDQVNDFYGIANEILNIAPSLYNNLITELINLPKADFNYFLKNIYPLYHVELILSQDNTGTNDGRNLVQIRKSYAHFFSSLENNKENKSLLFKTEEQRLSDVVIQLFQQKFGIIKIPETFTKVHIETIKNHSLYYANIHETNKHKEALLSFFLALKINGDRNSFRQGAEIDPTQYIDKEGSNIVAEYLLNRTSKDMFLDYDVDTKAKFQSAELSQIMGDFTTIDESLLLIDSSFDQLLDKDLYSKEAGGLMKILVVHGKETGKSLAMHFQQLQGRQITLTETQQQIVENVGLQLGTDMGTIDGLKRAQSILKSVSPIVNLVNKAKDINIPGKIDELKRRLLPDQELLELFNEWGIEMTTVSSVIASLDDISYLEVLLSKNQQELTDEQKKKVETYLGNIREYLLELHKDEDKLKSMFGNFKSETKKGSNELLKKRLEELSIVYEKNDDGESYMIISELSTDLDVVIKNIRACLSCKTKGVNNDTNLTFGDSNKFFVISHAGRNENSYSDQLVHYLSSSEGNLFVMDRIYGKALPDVLTNHIFTLCDKLKKIGNSDEGILIPDSVMTQSSLTKEHLIEMIKEYHKGLFTIEEVSTTVSIEHSASGEGHYEIVEDMGAREEGEQSLKGYVIRLK